MQKRTLGETFGKSVKPFLKQLHQNHYHQIVHCNSNGRNTCNKGRWWRSFSYSIINNQERDLSELSPTPSSSSLLAVDKVSTPSSSSLITDEKNRRAFKFATKRLVISKVYRLMSEDMVSRKCLFLVGPDGCGKTQTMIQIMEKMEKSNNSNSVPMYLDFEKYFLKSREEITTTQIPIDFDHFVEYCLDQICIEQLIKCVERSSKDFGVSDLMKILTERNNINYYFLRKFIASREDIKSIVKSNLDIKQLLGGGDGGSGALDNKEQLFKVIEKISEKLPYYNCKVSNSVRLLIDLLAFIELNSGGGAGAGSTGSGKKRSGVEVLSFLFSTLEYFANKPHFGIKPKLFINGLHFLDVFSKSVALLSRNDIRHYQHSIPEEVFSTDERGANLHDLVLLRIVAMYLDAFVPTIIEVSGNYYNYQMIPELKMDTEQVKYIEIIEDDMFEAKLQYANLFNDPPGCNNFETIYDIVGGNPSKIRTFYERYYVHNSPTATTPATTSTTIDELQQLNKSILNYLDGEKEQYERKIHMASLLAARYLALQQAEKKNLRTIQELSIQDPLVQFTIHDAIEKIMSLKGKAYHFNEEFDPFIQTIGGSILLNSELMYYQIHDNVLRPYDQSYYSYFAKTVQDLESSWSFVRYWYYRLIWQPLNGIKHVDRTLGNHANVLERLDESRHTPVVQP